MKNRKENKTMKKYTLSVGLNDQHTKRQEITTEKALDIIENAIYNHTFDGATLTEAMGLYKHFNGVRVREKSIIVDIIDFDNKGIENILSLIEELKDKLNQETIAMQVLEVQSMLY